jgi:tetratricopeptide (TPR) repeat protein
MANIENQAARPQPGCTSELAAAFEHYRAGRVERAAALCGEILDRRPDNREALHLLGVIALGEGQFECGERLGEAHANLGTALRGLGRLEAAEQAFRRAVQLEPDSAAWLTDLASVLAELERPDQALACCRRAIESDPRFARANYGLAVLLGRSGDLEEAVASYRNVLQLDPAHAVAWNALGSALRDLGRIDEAVDGFRRALAINPDFADAYRNLATCRQLTPGGHEIAHLAALAAKPGLPPEERAAAGFALGKAFDDSDRFDEAFGAYEQANRVCRDFCAAAGERFDAEELRRWIDEVIDAANPALFRSVAGWGNPSEVPVFIVGMPRSGTSLVEQIAASHSRVFGAGELTDIDGIADAIEPTFGEHSRAPVRRLADIHVERLRALGGDAERVIDKLPDNVFQLGVIAMLFPAARVIFCRRDPRDICLSCYFQKFRADHLVFAYDLADCANRYLETERLTEHWRRVLPLRMLDLQYEALVGDLEGESRRLIAFLGFDWEPACLDFHRT